MLTHANALPIVLSRGPRTLAALRPVELLVAIMRDGGLELREAVAAMNAIASAVRGMAGMYADDGAEDDEAALEQMASLPADEFPNLREAAPCWPDDVETEFDHAIRALVRGLLAEAPGRSL